MNSVQGYDLDNQGNIYISSQKSPDLEKKRDCKIFCVRMNYSLI
nr:helveticin J family class III bacteriocin [Lactobacillus helveticus]